jgi:hypothetical protein
LGFHYQREGVGIPLSERGDWYSIIRERGLGFHYQRERVGIPVTDLKPQNIWKINRWEVVLLYLPTL